MEKKFYAKERKFWILRVVAIHERCAINFVTIALTGACFTFCAGVPLANHAQ